MTFPVRQTTCGTTGSIITGHIFESYGGEKAFYFSLIPMTIRHIERVPGVVDVVSHLTYRIDDINGAPLVLRAAQRGPKVPNA